MFRCLFDSAIVCAGNSHIDESMDINTFDIDNQFINWMNLNLQSSFALIITVFMKVLYFLIQLNESFIGWIVDDDRYNLYLSYYKIIYCYSFIIIALTMIILWIKLIRQISLFESILFAEEYLNVIDDENNLDADTKETQPTIGK